MAMTIPMQTLKTAVLLLINWDMAVVSDRVVINGFLDFSENLTGVMKLSYFLVTFIQIFNFKYLSKGY